MAVNRTVIIADDHPIFRMGLAALIPQTTGLEIIGEAENGLDAIELIKKRIPHYIILDIDMPKANGIDVANYIMNSGLTTNIIFLTAHTDPVTIVQALSLKNVSIIFKESASRELKQCINTMENGGYFVSPICKKYSESRTEEQLRINKVIDSIKTFTVTEQKILLMISQGKTTAHIADTLNNSYKTIENHRTNISQKLNLAGSSTLLRFAMENEGVIKKVLLKK